GLSARSTRDRGRCPPGGKGAGSGRDPGVRSRQTGPVRGSPVRVSIEPGAPSQARVSNDSEEPETGAGAIRPNQKAGASGGRTERRHGRRIPVTFGRRERAAGTNPLALKRSGTFSNGRLKSSAMLIIE